MRECVGKRSIGLEVKNRPVDGWRFFTSTDPFLESGHRMDRCLGILEDAMGLHFRWTPALNLVLLVM